MEIVLQTFWWYVILKETGTIRIFDDNKDTFYNLMTDTTLADLENYVPWTRDLDKRTLSDNEVHLPGNITELSRWECGEHIELL